MDESASESVSRSVGASPRRLRRRIGFIVGLVLLAGAAAYLISDPEQLREFAGNIRHAPAWAVVIVLVGPLVNWVFVGLCLHALVRRHGVIGRGEMLALVGSAWLLNHLPMRPGLVGRIGYHAKVNNIRVRDSIEASVWSMIHGGIANAIAIGLVLLVPSDLSLGMLVVVLMIPIGVFAIVAGVGSIWSANLGYLILGLVFRSADVLVWMVRYAAAFAMLGITITPVQIALITAASQIAQVIPITGGGFGFREWGVGLAAKIPSSGAAITMRTAIGADVINRIAETIIVIPLGLICTGIVARRFTIWNASSGAKVDQELPEDQPADHAQDEDESGQPRQEQPADH